MAARSLELGGFFYQRRLLLAPRQSPRSFITFAFSCDEKKGGAL
jgi:hypothetical protein